MRYGACIVFGLLVLLAVPARAQYWCEYTPYGQPICLPPPVDDFERCPLCPNPGILKLNSDSTGNSTGQEMVTALQQGVEIAQKYKSIVDETQSILANEDKSDTAPFRTDAYALAFPWAARYLHDERTLSNIDLSEAEMADPRQVNLAVLDKFYTVNPQGGNDMTSSVLNLRATRSEILQRSAQNMLNYASTVQLLLTPAPDDAESHVVRMFNAYYDERRNVETITRAYGLIAATIRMRMAIKLTTQQLLNQRLEFMALEKMQAASSTPAPQLVATANATSPNPYREYNKVEGAIKGSKPDSSPTEIFNPEPGTTQHLIRDEMVRGMNAPYNQSPPAPPPAERRSEIHYDHKNQITMIRDLPTEKIIRGPKDATIRDASQDGYCPTDPSNPTATDFSAEALDRLKRVGNVSHCPDYNERGYSGRQPREVLFNTPASRAEAIAELHNTVNLVRGYIDAIRNFDDVVQCSNWANTQADYFWGIVKSHLGNAPFPQNSLEAVKAPLLNALDTRATALNGGFQIDYNLKTTDPVGMQNYARGTLTRFRHMANAACTVADTLMTRPAQIYDRAKAGQGQNCIPTIARYVNVSPSTAPEPEYDFCLGQSWPSGQRQSLAPMNIPNERQEAGGGMVAAEILYFQQVVPSSWNLGDQCRITYSYAGVMADPPLGSLGKWYQAEKIADKWYEDACGTSRDGNVRCGSNMAVQSAQYYRDDLNREMAKANEKFWAIVQGLNDADSRLAFERKPTTGGYGETAYIPPNIPQNDLRTAQGMANAKAAITAQVELLRAELDERRRNLAKAESDAVALGEKNDGIEAYKEWLRRSRENIATSRAGLDNLQKFTDQTQDAKYAKCKLGFGVDLSNIPSGMTVENGMITKTAPYNAADYPAWKDANTPPNRNPTAIVRGNFEPITPDCPIETPQSFLCLDKSFTPRGRVYYSPNIVDGVP